MTTPPIRPHPHPPQFQAAYARVLRAIGFGCPADVVARLVRHTGPERILRASLRDIRDVAYCF